MIKDFTIRTMIFCISLIAFTVTGQTQNETADFEDLNNGVDTFWNGSSSPLGTSFVSGGLTFQNYFDTSFGGFWTGGFAYSSVVDTVTGDFTNLYGAKPGSGYNGSDNYAIGQSGAKISFTNLTGVRTAKQLYVTNGTYAYETILNGGFVARKFGDTTGTSCGCPQGSYPDYFKLNISGWFGGVLINDTVEFYLADYRFSNDSLDYIIKDWSLIDISTLHLVDSIWFYLESTDNDPQFGMNTPDFFFVDNFEIDAPLSAQEILGEEIGITLYPNPAKDLVIISFESFIDYSQLTVSDLTGKTLISRPVKETNLISLDMNDLKSGIYFVSVSSSNTITTKKLIIE